MKGISTTTSITQKAVLSVKWSALIEMISRSGPPIVFIILARLLSPQDFGVMATATIGISFAQIFMDAGLGKALIQTKEAPEEIANIAFWISLVMGVVTYIALFCVAPWLAIFFNSPTSLKVLRVLSLQVVIASLACVPQALLVRSLDFRQLFHVKLITVLMPGLCSVPLAYFGYGVWSLVAGTLAGSLLNLLLLWKHIKWRPSLSIERQLAGKVLAFGMWVLGEGFLSWLFYWGDSVIVGRYLGTQDLGVYRVGSAIVSVCYGLFFNPFLPVIYPTLSRLQDNYEELLRVFHKVNRIVIAFCLPMGLCFLIIGAQGVASIVPSPKWQSLGMVVSLLGFRLGLVWVVGINNELYRAAGRPDVSTKIMAVTVVLYLPIYLWSISHGLHVFLNSYILASLMGISIQVYVLTRIFNQSVTYLWYTGKSVIAATLVMGSTIFLCNYILIATKIIPTLVISVVLLLVSVVTYFIALWFMDRTFVIETKQLFKKTAFD